MLRIEIDPLWWLAATRRRMVSPSLCRSTSKEFPSTTLDTVKRHVSHLLDKLGAANRTQAVARARELGLLR